MYKVRCSSSSSFFSTSTINTFGLKTGRKSQPATTPAKIKSPTTSAKGKSPTTPAPLGQPSDWYCCYGCCNPKTERCWERQCEEADCPIKEPHLNGPYYSHEAKPREYPQGYLWHSLFRQSNPPPHIWDAAELVECTHHRKLKRRQTEAEKMARREPIWMVERFQRYHMHPHERPDAGDFELRASDFTTRGRNLCHGRFLESTNDDPVAKYRPAGCHTSIHELPGDDDDDEKWFREVLFG